MERQRRMGAGDRVDEQIDHAQGAAEEHRD
jgi:hypothetical protein